VTVLTLPPWAQVTEERRAHITRVASLLDDWARAMAVGADERARWLRAAAVHDAVKDAPAEFLREVAPDAWDSDELRHGPAAAILAARDGEQDRGVLDAVRYHSVGYAGWDRVGRMLYVADYVEPGRRGRRKRRDEWIRRVTSEPRVVLCEVAQERIERTRKSGRVILPETRDFWDTLECDVPSLL
jgi:HD superfamily phosphohydrolase YqeK